MLLKNFVCQYIAFTLDIYFAIVSVIGYFIFVFRKFLVLVNFYILVGRVRYELELCLCEIYPPLLYLCILWK